MSRVREDSDAQPEVFEGQRKESPRRSRSPGRPDSDHASRRTEGQVHSTDSDSVSMAGVESDSESIGNERDGASVGSTPEDTAFAPIPRRVNRFRFSRYIPPVPATSNTGDYSKKFAEDPHGQEFGPSSRVYKVYLEEAAKRDVVEILDWCDSLDVWLIFAGLFSAVVTTFVVEASSDLKPDYGEINAYLQLENNALLRAIADHAPSSTVPTSPRSPRDIFLPSRNHAWVNGLWYLSLTLSLSAALITVLARQWLKYHNMFISGSEQDRARLIEARRRAASFWKLSAIIGTLPLLMHAAVFIFFAGLALLLSEYNIIISSVIIGIVCLTGCFYIISTILPLIVPQCCYVTPLTLALYAACHSIHGLWVTFTVYCMWYLTPRGIGDGPKRGTFKNSRRTPITLYRHLSEVFKWNSLLQTARLVALKDADLADVHVLQWLHFNASMNPSVPPIICEAISGIREGFTQIFAIKCFSGLIFEDWETEIRQLMAVDQLSRVERFFRMNAVLYTPNINLQTLRLHPRWTEAIISVAFQDQSMLRRFCETQMSCCGLTFDRAPDSDLDRSYWVHALLLLLTIGINETEHADAPLARLHPGAWINVFAHLIDLVRVQKETQDFRSTIECIRKHVDQLLPAVLNHYYQSTEVRCPYFKEKRIKKKNSDKGRAVELVTILELPPGHSRTRFLQFLYLYSTATPEHDFLFYIDFPAFIWNMAGFWHKTLLLYLKRYEIGSLPLGAVGVLRELEGVLQTPYTKQQHIQTSDSQSLMTRLNVFQRRHSALELEFGYLVMRSQKRLKDTLIEATFDILFPSSSTTLRVNPVILGAVPQFRSPTPISPSISESHPIFTVEPPQTEAPRVGSGSQPNPIIGVQLVSLIEALRRVYPTNSHTPAQSLIRVLSPSYRDSPEAISISHLEPGSELSPFKIGLSHQIKLDQAGNILLSKILHVILNTDVHQLSLSLQLDSITRLPMTTKKVCPSDVALAELSRSLENGSQIFVLSDGIDLIFEDLNLPEGLDSGMKRAQSLLAIFRAAQIVSSFIVGVLKMDRLDDAAGRNYLSDPGTLNKCCAIMVWSEFALYTLNAEGVHDRRAYSLLSKLRFANRSCLDKWWRNILYLTEIHPKSFMNAWEHVFGEGTILPQRPGWFQANSNAVPDSSSFAHTQGQESNLVARVALYKKRHYLWVEAIKRALDIDEAKYPQFQLYLFMTIEEIDVLKYLTRQHLRYTLAPPEEGWLRVKFSDISDEVMEHPNLTFIKETAHPDSENIPVDSTLHAMEMV